MAGVGVDPLGGLDAIRWPELHGAHGPAAEVPRCLRALRGNDPADRLDARTRLFDAVYHQGTRWQVSAHVIPFLVGLIDDPHTPDRAELADLLHAVAVGDRDDSWLPFDADRAFAEDPAAEEFDLAAVRWDAAAHRTAAGHLAAYRRWTADPDARLAAHAAALLAWFPATGAVIAALLAVPADRSPARASANLTLAHLPPPGPGIDARLRELLTSGQPAVAVTAATALAYRLGPALPDDALDVLFRAGDSAESPETPPGWSRSVRGFVALGLRAAAG